MWENNEYKIFIGDNTVHDFERIMLTSGDCSDLLPMLFIGEEGNQVAYYNCNGFTPLSSYKIDRTEDALFIMEKVLLIVSHVVEYLIMPAKITLSTDTVFFNFDTGEIKIAYVPISEMQPDLRRNLLSLIAQLKIDSVDSYKYYLDELANLIYANNYHVKELVNRVGLLRRDLYAKTIVS